MNTAARELSKIGELIRTQDNRITDQPIFIVQQRSRIYGLDDGHAEGHVWHYDGAESSYDDAAKAERDAERAEDGSPPLEWDQVGYIDTWEFVTACFTEQGCKDYIAINGHNLREPRIYAEGSFRNNEWRTVRDYLSAITPSPECTCPSGDGSLRWPCPTHPPITQQQGGEQEADVEQQARELLAAECERDGGLDAAKEIRAGYLTGHEKRAIRAISAALRSKQPAASEGGGQTAIELLGVSETLEEGDGRWVSCSGCHESNEGYPAGPYSDVFKCHLGGGCGECGGLGAVWDTLDYSQLGEDIGPAAITNTSKQAAGEAVELEQFRPAVVNWRNEQRGTIKQLEDSVSQLGSGTQKLVEDRLREADRLLAIIDNTSKQAAGEAVAWQIMRAAFVTADENYSGKRVAAVYADASMIGQRVRLIFDTTPSRHPADGAT